MEGAAPLRRSAPQRHPDRSVQHAVARALERLGELVRYGGDPELAQYVYTPWA